MQSEEIEGESQLPRKLKGCSRRHPAGATRNKVRAQGAINPMKMKLDKNSYSVVDVPTDEATPEAVPPPLAIHKILVPIDFSVCSLQALDYAMGFAERFKAVIVLLHVVEPTVHPDNYLNVAPALDESNQNLVEIGRERLEALAQERIAERLTAETLVRMGRAYSEIPDTAKALGADLIIIATHGYSGLKHVLLGSTTEKVIRTASCPVLTVRQFNPCCS